MSTQAEWLSKVFEHPEHNAVVRYQDGWSVRCKRDCCYVNNCGIADDGCTGCRKKLEQSSPPVAHTRYVCLECPLSPDPDHPDNLMVPGSTAVFCDNCYQDTDGIPHLGFDGQHHTTFMRVDGVTGEHSDAPARSSPAGLDTLVRLTDIDAADPRLRASPAPVGLDCMICYCDPASWLHPGCEQLRQDTPCMAMCEECFSESWQHILRQDNLRQCFVSPDEPLLLCLDCERLRTEARFIIDLQRERDDLRAVFEAAGGGGQPLEAVLQMLAPLGVGAQDADQAASSGIDAGAFMRLVTAAQMRIHPQKCYQDAIQRMSTE